MTSPPDATWGSVDSARAERRLRTPPAAVLLDRDGTLIQHVPYLTDPDQVELLPNASAGLRLMRSLGLKLAICSNQSVVGRGLCSSAQVDEVNLRVIDLLAQDEATVDAVLYCPHTPADGCACRKPAPGLGLRASRILDVPPPRMVVVGDQPSDMAFGTNLGASTVLIAEDPDSAPGSSVAFVARDLVATGRWLHGQLTATGTQG